MLVIHLSNVNDNLTAFESLLIWEVMLKPVKFRLYAPVLNLVMSELNGYPVGVKYHHRKCYRSFTHKLRLERLSKKIRANAATNNKNDSPNFYI